MTLRFRISAARTSRYANDPSRAIRCVRNWLSEHRGPDQPPLPGTTAMVDDYRRFQREVDVLLAARRLDSLEELTQSDFVFVVHDWMELRTGMLQ